ncbi:MAG: MJ0042-type zinc finger domain-containing protein [Parasphingorhabdus sp.]
MILNCPACDTRYLVPDSAIGPAGRSVRCASCRHSWFQDPAPLEEPVKELEVPAEKPETTSADQQTEEPDVPAATVSRAPPIPDPPSFASQESSFAHEPPFKPRRNPAKLWTIAAIVFALLITGAGGALYAFGLPNWFGDYQFASVEETPLLIELNPKQDRRTLQDGTEYFAASGTVINPTDSEHDIPPMLVVLRDASGRIVYSWKMKAPADSLAPGASVTFNEAKLDVPRAASQLEVGWVDAQVNP